MKLLIFSRGESVTHIKIHNKDDMLNLCGGESFPSLSDLVQFYMENPDQLQEKNGGTIVLRLVFFAKIFLYNLFLFYLIKNAYHDILQ